MSGDSTEPKPAGNSSRKAAVWSGTVNPHILSFVLNQQGQGAPDPADDPGQRPPDPNQGAPNPPAPRTGNTGGPPLVPPTGGTPAGGAADDWTSDLFLGRPTPIGGAGVANAVYDPVTNRSYVLEQVSGYIEFDEEGNPRNAEIYRPLDTGNRAAVYDRHAGPAGMTYVVNDQGRLEQFAPGDNRRARPTTTDGGLDIIHVVEEDPDTHALRHVEIEPLFVHDGRGGYHVIMPDEVIWYDTGTRRTFTLGLQDGSVTMHARADDPAGAGYPQAPAHDERPAYPDGSRVFNPLYNREYVFNAGKRRFEQLDPGSAPIYYHAPSNSTYIRNDDGSYGFFGAGDYRHNPNIETAMPGMDNTTPPSGYNWDYDSRRNQTFAVDAATGDRRPLDAGDRLAHYDENANVTFLIDLDRGHAIFFGRGDNRTARPGDIPGLAPWQERTGDWRLGGAFRVGPWGTTWGAVGGQMGTKTNYRRVIADTRQHGLRQGRRTLSEETAISVRPQEYRNITVRQWVDEFILPIVFRSEQFVLQIKGSSLMTLAERQLIWSEGSTVPPGSAYKAAIRKIEIAGQSATGPHQVIELSVRLSVAPDPIDLPPDTMDYLGTPAGDRHGFAALGEEIPFNKAFREQKDSLPIFTMEKRPEISFNGFPAGVALSNLFWAQLQSGLAHVDVRVQLIALDPDAIAALRATPTVEKLNALIAEGKLDRQSAFAFIPDDKGGLQTGMRLSAIPGKEAVQDTTDLTGRTRSRWHPDQTNLDVIFNQPYRGAIRWLPNADIYLHKLLWPLKNRAQRGIGRLPGQTGRERPVPQPLHLPRSSVRPYDIWDEAHHGQAAVRRTAAPGINLFGLIIVQGRVSHKSDVDNRGPLAWIAPGSPAAEADGVKLPPTARGAMRALLRHFEEEGDDRVKDSIKEFRRTLLPLIRKRSTTLSPAQLADIRAFFERPEIVALLASHEGYMLGDLAHAVDHGGALAVPGWLDRGMGLAKSGRAVMTHIGGQQAVAFWLDQLKVNASEAQLQHIEAFERTTLPKMKDGEMWTPDVIAELHAFRDSWPATST